MISTKCVCIRVSNDKVPLHSVLTAVVMENEKKQAQEERKQTKRNFLRNPFVVNKSVKIYMEVMFSRCIYSSFTLCSPWIISWISVPIGAMRLLTTGNYGIMTVSF